MNDYGYQKLRGLKRKLFLINLKGGKCERCGYDKNISAFDFHHRDPKNKDSQLDMRHLSNSNMNWIIEEFEKCDVLCSNCHREIHNPDLVLKDMEEKLKVVNESVISIKKEKKCCDCDIKVNYGSERCKKCAYIHRRKVIRPDIEILKSEIELNGMSWCVNKYNISRTTIRRWLGLI